MGNEGLAVESWSRGWRQSYAASGVWSGIGGGGSLVERSQQQHWSLVLRNK